MPPRRAQGSVHVESGGRAPAPCCPAAVGESPAGPRRATQSLPVLCDGWGTKQPLPVTPILGTSLVLLLPTRPSPRALATTLRPIPGAPTGCSVCQWRPVHLEVLLYPQWKSRAQGWQATRLISQGGGVAMPGSGFCPSRSWPPLPRHPGFPAPTAFGCPRPPSLGGLHARPSPQQRSEPIWPETHRRGRAPGTWDPAQQGRRVPRGKKAWGQQGCRGQE